MSLHLAPAVGLPHPASQPFYPTNECSVTHSDGPFPPPPAGGILVTHHVKVSKSRLGPVTRCDPTDKNVIIKVTSTVGRQKQPIFREEREECPSNEVCTTYVNLKNPLVVCSKPVMFLPAIVYIVQKELCIAGDVWNVVRFIDKQTLQVHHGPKKLFKTCNSSTHECVPDEAFGGAMCQPKKGTVKDKALPDLPSPSR